MRLLRPAPVDGVVVDCDHRICDALRGAIVMDGGAASFEGIVIDDHKSADGELRIKRANRVHC